MASGVARYSVTMRSAVGGLLAVRTFDQRQRARYVAGRQPPAAQRHATGRARCRRFLVRLQHFLEHPDRGALVTGALEVTRQRRNDAGALFRRRDRQQRAQRLGHVAEAVQRDQQLHHVAVRVHRFGQRGAPGLRGTERLLAGVALHGDFHGTLEQLLIVRAARRVEDHFVGGARLALAQLDLADQHLVEQRPVELGVARGGLRHGRLGVRWRLADGRLQAEARQRKRRQQECAARAASCGGCHENSNPDQSIL